jgi:hypothetical protein
MSRIFSWVHPPSSPICETELSSSYCRGQENVELYTHFPIRLQGQIYLTLYILIIYKSVYLNLSSYCLRYSGWSKRATIITCFTEHKVLRQLENNWKKIYIYIRRNITQTSTWWRWWKVFSPVEISFQIQETKKVSELLCTSCKILSFLRLGVNKFLSNLFATISAPRNTDLYIWSLINWYSLLS